MKSKIVKLIPITEGGVRYTFEGFAQWKYEREGAGMTRALWLTWNNEELKAEWLAYLDAKNKKDIEENIELGIKAILLNDEEKMIEAISFFRTS